MGHSVAKNEKLKGEALIGPPLYREAVAFIPAQIYFVFHIK